MRVDKDKQIEMKATVTLTYTSEYLMDDVSYKFELKDSNCLYVSAREVHFFDEELSREEIITLCKPDKDVTPLEEFAEKLKQAAIIEDEKGSEYAGMWNAAYRWALNTIDQEKFKQRHKQ